MRDRFAAGLLVLSFLAVQPPSHGQAPATDQVRASPGDSIHFKAPKLSTLGTIRGTLVAVRADSLYFVRAGPDTAVRALPFYGVSDLWINHGNRPPRRDVGHYAREGAIYGGISGFMLGGFFAWCSEGFTCNGSSEQKATMIFGGLAIGAAAGALVGTTIGLVHERSPYERVRLSSLGTIALFPLWDPAKHAGGVVMRMGF